MTTAINKANTAFNTINQNFSYLEEQLNRTGLKQYTASCLTLTPQSGLCSWNITHNLETQNVTCRLYNSSGKEIIKNTNILSANQVKIEFKSSSTVSSGSHKIVIIGV
jgi:effector-binding domain-containing protein